ncbi:hypothetical protein Tco_0401970 [Tanacetum coccineum]
MEDRDMTMEEYVQYETKKALTKVLLGACSYMLRHSYVLDVILHEILNICHLLIMPSCDLVDSEGISLKGFAAVLACSHYLNISKQTTPDRTSTYSQCCLMLTLEGFSFVTVCSFHALQILSLSPLSLSLSFMHLAIYVFGPHIAHTIHLLEALFSEFAEVFVFKS